MLDNFRFIDLYAGIGGFHKALSATGGKCVFASETDEFAKKTYRANYNMDFTLAGDIKIYAKHPELIPQHDFLCAGFPCQPFSHSGVGKGFDDFRGKAIFDIMAILRHHLPEYFLRENVKTLVSHQNSLCGNKKHENR